MTPLEHQIRDAEAGLFAELRLEVEESWLPLVRSGVRVRVLEYGAGPPVILLHGVTLSAAVWAPLLPLLPARRLLAVDLPGHGLSDPISYRPDRVREQAHGVIDDILDALGVDRASVVGHSLGGMFALWYAARGGERIAKLAAVADPAVAFPGTRVRMPLSMLTVPGLGPAMLRAPAPRWLYRGLVAQGLGGDEVAGMSGRLLEVLRLAGRRPANASSVASVMRAINHFRRPRAESVLTPAELARIRATTVFIWGSRDRYLSPQAARPAIEQIPGATLHEVPGGHGPWLVDGARVAELLNAHLAG